jgi:hypothetical protein
MHALAGAQLSLDCHTALALKARDNNFNDYAAQLEELAAEASAYADRVQKRSGQQQQRPRPDKPE